MASNIEKEADDIIERNRATFDLHCFSAAYAITPTLVNFYREHVSDTTEIKKHYEGALRQAIINAIASPTLKTYVGEYREGIAVVMFRFEARARIYKETVTFELSYRLNSGSVRN